MRQLAWEYGRKLQPSRGAFKTLYDALQLGACGVPLPLGAAPGDWSAQAQPATPAGALELLVDPVGGDDTLAAFSPVGDHPFATIAAAIATAVTARQPGQAAHVVLRGGTHFVADTIELTAAHSHLTIRNADGEAAIVSGGVNITEAWLPSKRCPGCFEADLSKEGVQQVHGLRKDGVREIRARFPNFVSTRRNPHPNLQNSSF